MAHLPQLLSSLHASRRPAVAVSGGADSMALALLAQAWGDPLALIVDHGLRTNSADEARLTAGRLDAIGMPNQVLTLAGLNQGPALAERARRARYAALTAATRQAGRVDLWLGHHQRDQAETVLMRRLSRSGEAGLSAMAGVTETRDVRLLRPLLGTAPGALRRLLVERGVAWVEDPGNDDPAALRTRLRRSLDDPEGNASATRALASDAQAAGWLRADRDAQISGILASRAAIYPEGFALLTPGQIDPAALGRLIRAIGGRDYTPSEAALGRLAACPHPATLCGVRLLPAGRLGPGLLLVREADGVAPPVPARAGAVWDRRFLVTRNHGEVGMIGAVGMQAAVLLRHTALPAAILQTLPAHWLNGVLEEVPHIGYRRSSGPARMTVSFAPASPASGAPFGIWAPGDAEPGRSPHLPR